MLKQVASCMQIALVFGALVVVKLAIWLPVGAYPAHKLAAFSLPLWVSHDDEIGQV